MKKTPILPIALLLLPGLICCQPSQAQFFKNVLNSVKQTVQSKSNDKASQVTSKSFDKVTGLPDSKTKTGSTGTTGTTGTPPGSGKSGAAANPSDTSAGAATMKALGLFTGGGGVSAADSAAAIKSFRTASGSSGYYYQWQTTATSKRGTSRDTSNTYFASNGNGRNEMRINMPGATSGKIITIGHAAQRGYTILLDPDDKTYSLNIIDTGLINSGAGETYQVKKIGTEMVQGYSCIHSRLTSTIGSGMFKSTSTEDIWTSTAVPGYELFMQMASIQNVKPKMMVALENAGAGGFFVKMTAGDKNYSMTMVLAKAEQKTFPASMFMIPAGYKESNETMMSHMMKGAK
jgi:hypothetical protein